MIRSLSEAKWPSWSALVLPALLFLARDSAFFASLSVPDGRVLFDHLVLTPLALAAWLVLAFGAGSNFLRHVFRLVHLEPAEEIVLAIPIGFGLFSLLILALGLCGVLNAGVFLAIAAFLALIFQERIRYLLRTAGRALGRFRSEGLEAFFQPALSPAELLCLSLVLWTAWHGLVLALAPPTDGDSLAYHLAHAQDFLRAGRIYCRAGDLWGTFPGNMEMQYLAALLLKGENLAQLLPWTFSLILPAAVALFGRRFFGSRAVGLLAAAVFAVQPVVTAFLGTAMEDEASVLLVFLAIFAFFRFRETGEARWMGVSGACAGLAAGTKYSALPFAGLLFVFAAIGSFRPRFRLKPLLAFSFFAVLLGGGWYLRNAVWTGNPFWPLFNGAFHGRYLDADQAAVLSSLEAQPGQERTVAGWLKLPWRMVSRLRFGHYYNPEYITWPFLLLLPWLFARRARPPLPAVFFAAFAVLGSAFVFSTASFWRYLMPALPGLCLILAWAAEAIGFPGRPAAFALIGVMSVAAVRLTQLPALYPAFGLRVPGGVRADPRTSYLTSTLPYYPLYQWADANLPPDARVLLVEQSDAYHLRRDWLPSDPLYQTLIRYRDLRTTRDLADRLRELGVTHILFNEEGEFLSNPWDRERLPDWYWQGRRLLRNLIFSRGRLLKRFGGYSLYEFHAEPVAG